MCVHTYVGFAGGSVVKHPPANAGDAGSIPESGGSPGEGNGNPLQYPCLENPMDRGAWRATAHGVIKSQTRLKQLVITQVCMCVCVCMCYTCTCVFVCERERQKGPHS